MVMYNGKRPGKLWYFWQKTKAVAMTPFQYTTEKDAKAAGKYVGKFAGIAIATSVVVSLPIVAALPFVPMLVSLAGFSWALNNGWKGIQKIGLLKDSSFVNSYVHQQEDKWMRNKVEGNVLKRTWKSFTDKVKGVTSGIKAKIPTPLVKAGKWVGVAAAAVGGVAAAAAGLSYAGIPAFSTGAAATTILGGIAQAGAVVGLSAAAAVATVTGIAVAAVPAGLAAAAWARKEARARDPGRQVFKKPVKPASTQPIDKGEVFTPKAVSYDFNDSSPSGTPSNDDARTAERKRIAEQRAANRKRGGGSNNRFN